MNESPKQVGNFYHYEKKVETPVVHLLSHRGMLCKVQFSDGVIIEVPEYDLSDVQVCVGIESAKHWGLQSRVQPDRANGFGLYAIKRKSLISWLDATPPHICWTALPFATLFMYKEEAELTMAELNVEDAEVSDETDYLLDLIHKQRSQQ